MAKQIKRFKRLLKTKAFTLVELIIVIAIVAILSVVAFMVVTKWIGKSKDSRRLADLGTMKRSLEVGLAENNYVPMPDVSSGGVLMTGVIGTKEAVYAGVYGDTVVKTLKNMKSAPIDPVSQVNYGYGIDSTRKKYEVAVTLEDGSVVTDLTNSAYAGTLIARVEGNYGLNDMYVYDDVSNKVVAVPSLIITGSFGVLGVDLTDKTKVKYVVDKGNNLPYKTVGDIDMTPEDPVTSLKRVTDRAEISEISVDLSAGTSAEKLIEIVKLAADKSILNTITNKVNTQEGSTLITSADVGSVTLPSTSYKESISTNKGCGSTIHGGTSDFYDTSSVSFGQTCSSHKKTFTCDNGTWKDGAGVANTETYSNTTCTVGTAANCGITTWSGYNISAQNHGVSQQYFRTITNGTGDVTATCNNGVLSYNVENINCITNFVSQGGTCVADLCNGNAPDYSVVNGTQKIGLDWTYNTTAGQCTYVCQAGYVYDGVTKSCKATGTFNLSSTSVTVGTNVTITNNCSVAPTSYTSSNTSVAIIVGTTITTLSAGTVNITPVGGSCGDNSSKSLTVTTPLTFLQNCTGLSSTVGIIYTNSSGVEIARVSNDGTIISGNPNTLTCAGNIIVCSGINAGYILSACNVGATTVYTNQTFASATASRDLTVNSWAGGLYQWGRDEDVSTGSFITNTYVGSLTSSKVGNNNFYKGDSTYPDWWQTEVGSSSPTRWTGTNVQGLCPTNYHIPTGGASGEWKLIYNAGGWASIGTNPSTALSNSLRLPLAGYRVRNVGTMNDQGTYATYWSTTPGSTNAYSLNFDSSSINPVNGTYRAYGFSLRCLKN